MNSFRFVLLCLTFLVGSACTSLPSPPASKRIAITFDDAPRRPGVFLEVEERSERLIAGLRQAGVRQAAFFVTVGNLEKPAGVGGEQRIAAYVRAGHVIANHSWSHKGLSSSDVDIYLSDLDRAEDWLRSRPGYRSWHRFPFLDEGGDDKAKRDLVRMGLASRGLRNGYVTVDASDWHLEQLTIEAVRAGKQIDMPALRELYIESHVEAAEFYDALARRATGRSPAHVLLLHETDLAALYIVDLVKALRRQGWQIVTADEAYRDRLGRVMPDVPVARGTLTEAIAWERGVPAPRWYERNDTSSAARLFAKRVLGEASARPAT